MKKIAVLFLIVALSCLCFVGCGEHENDHIEVWNKGTLIYDNVHIPIKEGYFYDDHEKFTVDEDTVGVTIYFSKDEVDDSWD